MSPRLVTSTAPILVSSPSITRHPYHLALLPPPPHPFGAIALPKWVAYMCSHTGNNFLIIFGGMAIQLQSDNPEDLCVLNDVRLFDLGTRRWLPDLEYSPSSPIPKARYAHLSSITADRLFVIGGQDLNNVWLDDVHVYDLKRNDWVLRRDYPRHCGTYRSVAVTANKRVRLPQEDQRSSQLGAAGTRFSTDANAPPTPDATQSESLIHLPYSTEPTDDYPCDILLFSNYNVRALDLLISVSDTFANLRFSSLMYNESWKCSRPYLVLIMWCRTARHP